jgi:hypothetical protein
VSWGVTTRYQESHFALRSLFFIDGQVAFRCNGNTTWEEHVFEDPDELPTQRGGHGGHDRIGTYEEFIRGFSERDLTVQTDVYNAFAGVARELTCRLNTDLCHGIPTVFFDWFLLWGPLTEHTRRLNWETRLPVGPSWSWSGWAGCSWSHMWDWYNPSIKRITNAIPNRTWIIWYQRESHSLTETKRLVRHHKDSANPSSEPDRNFYGHRSTHNRFHGLDCSRVEPTKLLLTHAQPPTYVKDILSNQPGSGFLQVRKSSPLFFLPPLPGPSKQALLLSSQADRQPGKPHD